MCFENCASSWISWLESACFALSSASFIDGIDSWVNIYQRLQHIFFDILLLAFRWQVETKWTSSGLGWFHNIGELQVVCSWWTPFLITQWPLSAKRFFCLNVFVNFNNWWATRFVDHWAADFLQIHTTAWNIQACWRFCKGLILLLSNFPWCRGISLEHGVSFLLVNYFW